LIFFHFLIFSAYSCWRCYADALRRYCRQAAVAARMRHDADTRHARCYATLIDYYFTITPIFMLAAP